MTNKETMAILKDFKGDSKLRRRVVNEIVAMSKDYSGENLQERILGCLEDISYGLSSGIVGSMIYYSDTCKFFKKYREEIEELVIQYSEETGCPVWDLNGWDSTDPFARDTTNQNLLAWFAYETVAFDLGNLLECQ